MKERRLISIIYGILLIIGILLCMGAYLFIPVGSTVNNQESGTEIVPDVVNTLNEDVREYIFRNVDWSTGGTCLHFVSSHQEISVKADENIIFERKAVQTLWGHTTGYAWEYIEIPENTEEVVVTVTACYPVVRTSTMVFFRGYSKQMMMNIFDREGFTAIVSFLNTCFGVILLLYGIISYRRTGIGGAMVYLGIFCALLGILSLSENGITAVRISNRAAASFVSMAALALVGIPFIMFIRCYLETDDKYMYRVLIGINLVNIVLVFLLQFLGIADMKQTVSLSFTSLVAAFFYQPFSLVRKIEQKRINRKFCVTVFSMFCMLPPLAYSMSLYYSGLNGVNGYSNVFIFIFVAIFAIDVSIKIVKDIDAGRRAEIYKELAENDLLTGCYNRNAYRNDTKDWGDLQDVLLVTCDLNNLKQCNDTLGHACGDQYICDSATILKKIFSSYGNVYRIGGDEFCVIIRDSSKCDIEKLIADIRQEEQKYNAVSELINLQIACGYAVYDEKTDSTIEDIRIRADEKMYEDKKRIKK